MKLPLWVYDYKQKKYVRFPFELLTTLPDGSRGFTYDPSSSAHQSLLKRFGHLFTRDMDLPYNNPLLWPNLVYRLREPRERRRPKGSRWYSEENHQVKKYKRTRR